MTARFASNLIVLLASCFLAAASFAFSSGVLAWLGLGVGALVALTVLAAFATSGRGLVQRALDGLMLLLAAWTIVASRCFPGGAEKWLMFSAATAALLLAVQGLIAHEVVLELSLRRATEAEAEARRLTPSGPEQSASIRVAG